MGEKPIIEKAEIQDMPEDGRITLGEEYAHRKVPVAVHVPEDSEEFEENSDAEHGWADQDNWEHDTVAKFDADSRGRITLSAPVRERYDRVLWIVSEPALEHGSVPEAFAAQAE